MNNLVRFDKIRGTFILDCRKYIFYNKLIFSNICQIDKEIIE